ncbi:unnamed protein product [Thelazia callipaeda]|uniref:Sensor histidine kinase n=1 Tax=Thelazia callipaeda TaxID=103827 RepID=A0A0N5D9F0_THECL|nr:unnamed protein product [Thelazia callipaeda]
MNLRSVLWSRLTWIFSSFTLFILYLTEYRNYHVKYAYLADRYSKLLVHSGGLSAQLQLMMERNHRAEKMLTDMRNRHSQIIKEIDKKQHGNELLWSLCKNALYKCFIGVLKGSEQKKRKKILISYKDVKYRNCIVECQENLCFGRKLDWGFLYPYLLANNTVQIFKKQLVTELLAFNLSNRFIGLRFIDANTET